MLPVLANKNSLHRRLRIVELVRKRGEVSVDELATAFDVSSVTIRSDLNYLEQQRYLIRASARRSAGRGHGDCAHGRRFHR